MSKEELTLQRDRLALAVAEGQAVDEDLAHVEYELDMLALDEGRQADRAAGAERARQARTEEEIRQLEEKRRQEQRRELERLVAERGRLAAEFERQAAELRATVDELAQVGDRMVRLTGRQRLHPAGALGRRLASVFHPYVTGRPTDHGLRAALPALLPMLEIDGQAG